MYSVKSDFFGKFGFWIADLLNRFAQSYNKIDRLH